MDAVVYCQPALILQQRKYRESSLLLDVFTRDYGIISILAKGIRKEKSKLAGLLLPFVCLNISYFGKSELKTLTQAEFVNKYELQGMSLYCAFYVNELLQKFLHKFDPYPELFVEYQQCLQELRHIGSVEQTLRYFELTLLQVTGYAITLDRDCDSGVAIISEYRYDFLPNQGMKLTSQGLVSGKTLLLLSTQAPLDKLALAEAKLLLRKMLDIFLQGKPLQSRKVLAKIIKFL